MIGLMFLESLSINIIAKDKCCYFSYEENQKIKGNRKEFQKKYKETMKIEKCVKIMTMMKEEEFLLDEIFESLWFFCWKSVN